MTDYPPNDDMLAAAHRAQAPGAREREAPKWWEIANRTLERQRDEARALAGSYKMDWIEACKQRAEARAEVDRLKALLASAEDEAREAAEAAAELRADVERLGRP